MKTVLMIPGLDALFQSAKFKRWLEVDCTRRALDEASLYLMRHTGQLEDLARFFEVSHRPHIADFDRTLVGLTAIQVGIARGLVKRKQQWDVVLGCSHGDIARSVIAGVISLEQAVDLLWLFAGLRKTCPEGFAASVRPVQGALTDAHIKWLEEMGLPVSRWSDEHATVAGTTATLKAATELCRARGLKVTPVLRYPVHSSAMQPAVDVLKRNLDTMKFGRPLWPIFSSVYAEYIADGHALVEEALTGAVRPIRWVESIQRLRVVEGATHFINVGPCNTLTGWILGSPLMHGAELTDAWDLINGGASSGLAPRDSTASAQGALSAV